MGIHDLRSIISHHAAGVELVKHGFKFVGDLVEDLVGCGGIFDRSFHRILMQYPEIMTAAGRNVALAVFGGGCDFLADLVKIFFGFGKFKVVESLFKGEEVVQSVERQFSDLHPEAVFFIIHQFVGFSKIFSGLVDKCPVVNQRDRMEGAGFHTGSTLPFCLHDVIFFHGRGGFAVSTAAILFEYLLPGEFGVPEQLGFGVVVGAEVGSTFVGFSVDTDNADGFIVGQFICPDADLTERHGAFGEVPVVAADKLGIGNLLPLVQNGFVVTPGLAPGIKGAVYPGETDVGNDQHDLGMGLVSGREVAMTAVKEKA